MKAKPLSLLLGAYPRLRSITRRSLSVLTVDFGRLLKQYRNHDDRVAAVERRGNKGILPRIGPHELPAEERFAIVTTIRYREAGQNGWYQGKKENISASGVLFMAENLVALKTRVEMIFSLPVVGPGACGAYVRCFGQIVREARPVAPGGETGLAATIEEYHLMRTDSAAIPLPV